MKPAYVESLGLIERLHRRFLEVVRGELERMDERDINNVQSLILFNMGQDELSVGELTSRGCYLGTNVSYNLKKLIEAGYVNGRDETLGVTAKGHGLIRLYQLAQRVFRHGSNGSEVPTGLRM